MYDLLVDMLGFLDCPAQARVSWNTVSLYPSSVLCRAGCPQTLVASFELLFQERVDSAHCIPHLYCAGLDALRPIVASFDLLFQERVDSVRDRGILTQSWHTRILFPNSVMKSFPFLLNLSRRYSPNVYL